MNLPRYRKHVPHKSMPDAIAHSQTHTADYHDNVFTVLAMADSTATSKEDIFKVLREIATDLQSGGFLISGQMI